MGNADWMTEVLVTAETETKVSLNGRLKSHGLLKKTDNGWQKLKTGNDWQNLFDFKKN